MRIEAELREILDLVKEAYESGAKEALGKLGHRDYMTQNEAFAKYGRKTVETWRDAKIIRVFKDKEGTSRIRIPVEDLQVASMSSNIHRIAK